jgi:hypothetical protein
MRSWAQRSPRSVPTSSARSSAGTSCARRLPPASSASSPSRTRCGSSSSMQRRSRRSTSGRRTRMGRRPGPPTHPVAVSRLYGFSHFQGKRSQSVVSSGFGFGGAGGAFAVTVSDARRVTCSTVSVTARVNRWIVPTGPVVRVIDRLVSPVLQRYRNGPSP